MRGTLDRMLAGVLAVAALTACQSADDPGPTPAPTAGPTGPTATTGEPMTDAPTTDEATTTEAPTTGQATETDVPSALPPWTSDTVEEDVRQAGERQEITGVRTGRHDGFDRVVLDLTGDEPSLGWFAALVDEAVHDPIGDPLDVDGDRFLDVAVRGIDWTTDAPERYAGGTVEGQGTEVVTEVVFGGLFEGQQQVVVGLEEDTTYRVFSLSDPARIVIDVQHP